MRQCWFLKKCGSSSNIYCTFLGNGIILLNIFFFFLFWVFAIFSSSNKLNIRTTPNLPKCLGVKIFTFLYTLMLFQSCKKYLLFENSCRLNLLSNRIFYRDMRDMRDMFEYAKVYIDHSTSPSWFDANCCLPGLWAFEPYSTVRYSMYINISTARRNIQYS